MALLVLTATLPNRVAVVIFWNHRGLSGDSHIIWLFGGSCGLTPRRRCQPGSGATRAEPVFPTEREGPARGRRRHAVAAEALVPPGTARVAIRIATRVATVYTNAPIRRGEAILANLCTLLRRRQCGDAHAVGAVTQPPTHTNSRSLYYLSHIMCIVVNMLLYG